VFFHNEAQGGAWPQATAWPAARSATAWPAGPGPRRGLAGAACGRRASAGAQRRLQPADGSGLLLYTPQTGDFYVLVVITLSVEVLPSPSDKKAVINFFCYKKRVGGMGIKYGRG